MAKNDKGTWAEESAGYKKWAEKEFGAERYKPKKKKKKYTGKFKTRQPEIEWANVTRREGSFGDAFKKHKAAGDKKFTWKGKSYTTRTKAELETGVAEKEKFTREAKRKASPQSKGKKSWLKTFGESKTLKEFAQKMKARKS